jgi:hypothetical protein
MQSARVPASNPPVRMITLNPEDLVGAGIESEATGEAGTRGVAGTGVPGTATGPDMLCNDPGTACPALFCWIT